MVNCDCDMLAVCDTVYVCHARHRISMYMHTTTLHAIAKHEVIGCYDIIILYVNMEIIMLGMHTKELASSMHILYQVPKRLY